LSGESSIRYADVESAVIPLLPREADAFKANHHCVDYNNNPKFLAALSPTVSLVSTSHEVVGWKCILRLEKISEVYITDQIPAHKAAGDIVLTSRDGDTFEVAGKTYQSK
jgi:beta-lactamase superfamily II metal-dependent hydrolase